ncbi:WbqC family protein [Vreelandella utahensis]|nr:WbqC family protein [Halomonas utahensis]
MQPYLFPYIGYFQLMSQVDTWIIFDDIQFTVKGWVNRNRILHPDHRKTWQYITIPINRKDRFTHIKNVTIPDPNWKLNFFNKLSSYRQIAPNYSKTLQIIHKSLPETETFNLIDILEFSLTQISHRFNLNPTFYRQSELINANLDIRHPGQWALRICEHLGASNYYNLSGAPEIFSEEEFDNSGIHLWFVKPNLKPYNQKKNGFVPGLSIIDALMWNSLDEVAKMAQSPGPILTKSEICNE